jgi:hypothetical protein
MLSKRLAYHDKSIRLSIGVHKIGSSPQPHDRYFQHESEITSMQYMMTWLFRQFLQ